jgi:hypothetical protein
MRVPERSRRPPGHLVRIGAAAVLATLAGCIDIPRAFDLLMPSGVAGLPAGAPWTALPLRSWIAESEARPQGIAACVDPACPAPLAVGVFEAKGDEARLLAEVLDEPQKLQRALEAQDAADVGRAQAIRTAVAIEPWSDGALRGFAIRLSRADNARQAYGAVLATRAADPIRFAIAVGADAEAVQHIAREVAAANLR